MASAPGAHLRDDARPLRALHGRAVARIQHLGGRRGAGQRVGRRPGQHTRPAHPKRGGCRSPGMSRVLTSSVTPNRSSSSLAMSRCRPCTCRWGAATSIEPALLTPRPTLPGTDAAAARPCSLHTRLLLQGSDAAHAVSEEGAGVLHVGYVVRVAARGGPRSMQRQGERGEGAVQLCARFCSSTLPRLLAAGCRLQPAAWQGAAAALTRGRSLSSAPGRGRKSQGRWDVPCAASRRAGSGRAPPPPRRCWAGCRPAPAGRCGMGASVTVAAQQGSS